MAAVETTGAEFAGELVNVSFNISRCLKPKVPKDECYTIFEGGSCKTKGRVVAYVDRVLLENVELCVRESGVMRIRDAAQKKGKAGREVIAWARGTVRDPDDARAACRLGRWADWEQLTFCPYTDVAFMVKEGSQGLCKPAATRRQRPGEAILKAKWVYFESHHSGVGVGVVCRKVRARPNPGGGYDFPIRCSNHLYVLADEIGGRIEA